MTTVEISVIILNIAWVICSLAWLIDSGIKHRRKMKMRKLIAEISISSEELQKYIDSKLGTDKTIEDRNSSASPNE